MTTSPSQTVWARCLDTVAQEVTPQAFKTWFAPLRPVRLEQPDGVDEVELCLELPSRFYREWLDQHYGPLLNSILAGAVGRPARITFSVGGPAEVEAEAPTLPPAPQRKVASASDALRRPREQASAPLARQEAPPVPRAAAPAEAFSQTAFNSKYTFERFVEGDCNRLARSAALAIAERPGGTSFNPFLIYGGVGLGKTHLVQAIGNYVQTHGAAERVRYVSSEQFTSEFVQAIQRNRIMEFTSFYRQMDLLIVDDIQFFGGKDKTQEEFFHIFNDLHQRGKQVILCADRAPREIAGIEERLLSRFQWGLTADVQMPDFETRMAILMRKAESEGVVVPGDVIEYIADRLTTSIRELEGSLIRLLAHARLQRRAVDLDLAQEALRGLLREKAGRLEPVDIQRIVAEFYDLDSKLLLGASRKREIVGARHAAIYLCKQYTQHTLKSLGALFGGRDHSTVIHACSAIENRLDTDPAFRDEFASLRQKLKSLPR